MKTLRLILACMVLSMTYTQSYSQCTSFINDPTLLNIPNCNQTISNPIPFSQANAYILPNLMAGSLFIVDICGDQYPLPENQMELVITDPLLNIIAQSIGCFIEFEVPSDGDYFFIFNEVGNCGVPSSAFGTEILVNQNCPCFLDRQQVVQFALDPTSDFQFADLSSTMWCPFQDFGFGPGFEGLLPAGTQVYSPMATSSVFVLPFDAYFFYLDLDPLSRFSHPTQYIFVDPTVCDPSISNEGIFIIDEMWWPVIELPGDIPFEPFPHESVSEFPPAPDNILGLIDGLWTDINEIFIPNIPLLINTTSKAAAIVVAGDNRSDMRADIPAWKKQLQDSIGVDSARILCAANDSAVTAMQFCDLLDTLCALPCKPDTVYIRISSHGGIGTLSFANGTSLTKNQLCTKLKKVAKLGVPIMLTIDACNTASLYDANNWGFPAGSMIIVGAASGRSAYGGTYSEGTANGTAVPGTQFTGAMLAHALTKCQNDTTDTDGDGYRNADTNKNGKVDDCEAFNWVDSQNPCYMRAAYNPPRMIGSYTISHRKYFPAGRPPGFVADTVIVQAGVSYFIKGNAVIHLGNPNPSYRAVGKFGKHMNWNVQNMSGSDKNAFYMTFCGDVSGGVGSAWRSNAADSLMELWSLFFGATATYNALFDETTVCWMAGSGAATNGQFIHFGYSNSNGDLKPKRQTWANLDVEFSGLGLPMIDNNSVPTTQSDIQLDGTGTMLTVRTVNLNNFQGGTGHPVNYTIGYRVSPTEIPLENLALADPQVNSLIYHIVGSGIIDTNDVHQFELQVPNEIQVGRSLILQVELNWTLNGNTNCQLIQWPALEPKICEGDLNFVDGQMVPRQINSDGKIILNDVIFQSGITTLNAKNGVDVTPGSQFDIPLNATVYIYNFGCQE